MPDKKLLVSILILISIVAAVFITRFAYADELEDINEEIEEKEKEYESTSQQLASIRTQKDSISQKLTQLSSQLGVTQEEINDLEKSITAAEKELAIINENLANRKDSLSKKIDLRNKIVRDYSKSGLLNDLEMFFAASPTKQLTGFQFSAFNYIFDKSLNKETIKFIDMLNGEITAFEADKAEGEKLKAELEAQQNELVSLKKQLETQKSSAQNEYDNLQKQQNSFEKELASISETLSDLTAKQQSILKEKYGSESETVGNYESDGAELPDPTFSPAYAFYTYGYPHRVGMSQYGAYGRSKAGQKYDTILKAYFKNTKIEKKYNDDEKIPVAGYGNIKLKDYLLGIAEMPESWGDKGGYEALKAQVVAARTYAMNYIYYTWDSKSGSFKDKSAVTICTTQSCQVYNGGKKSGKWADAVDDTKGEVITYNGKPVTAWYASTAGAFTRSAAQVWGSTRPWAEGIKDTACSGDLDDCAYDGPKYGDSPWFHKAWDSGYSAKNAWMTDEEVQDIVNAYLMWKKDESSIEHLSPPDKDDDAWSKSELKDKMDDKGVDPVGAINEIKAYDDGNGYTTKVVVKSDNYSNLEIDGYDFKTIFNLRSREKLYIYTAFYSIRTEK